MTDTIPPHKGKIILEVILTLTKLGEELKEVQLSSSDNLAYWSYNLPHSIAPFPFTGVVHGVIVRLDREGKEGQIRARFARSGWRTVNIETIWSILHSLPTSRLSRILETDLI